MRKMEVETLIGDDTIINIGPDPRVNITHGFPYNFIFIVSLDGIGGSPVVPTTGTFKIYVRLVRDGGFHSLTDNGTINADLTGGSSMADGKEKRSSFNGNPYAIKVVPSGVDVAGAYRVTVLQNSN